MHTPIVEASIVGTLGVHPPVVETPIVFLGGRDGCEHQHGQSHRQGK
jgi:hypothetical protein